MKYQKLKRIQPYSLSGKQFQRHIRTMGDLTVMGATAGLTIGIAGAAMKLIPSS